MALPSALNILRTGTELVDRTFQNIKEAVDILLAAPLTRGRQLSGVKLNNGRTVVVHGLGRVPNGLIVTRKSGAADVSNSSSLAANPDQQIALQSSAAVTIDAWVY